MRTVDGPALRSVFRTSGAASVIMLLCVCVVVQMLGVPFTFLGLLSADLLNSDMLTESESESEDLTALSLSAGLERPRLFYSSAELRAIRHLPLLPISVFHPPLF